MRCLTLTPVVRPLAMAGVLLGGVLVLGAAPAAAQDECQDVPECQAISANPIRVRPAESITRIMTCPSDAQYAWRYSWDKDSANLIVEATLDSPTAARFEATNWSPLRAAMVTFHLGCSPRPHPTQGS